MALPFFISSFVIPLIGLYIDKNGKRGKLLILSGSIGIITYLLFILINPLAPLVLLGVCYSIFAAVIWPAITLVVPKELIVYIYDNLGNSYWNYCCFTKFRFSYISYINRFYSN